MPLQHSIYLYRISALLLFVLLICFQLLAVHHLPLWHDNAIYGSVAKNLIAGKGYASVYFNQFVAFDTGITAGPLIILPAAAMIGLFGNPYWMPGLTGILLIDSLLIIIFFQFRRLPDAVVSRWPSALLFLILMLLVTNHDIGAMHERMQMWHGLMGDIPGALLIILSVLHAAKNPLAIRTMTAAGLIAGLAVLCKLQVLFGTIGFLAYLVAYYVILGCSKKIPWSNALYLLGVYSAALVFPGLMWEIAKFLFAGHEVYVSQTNGTAHVIGQIVSLSDSTSILRKIFTLGEFAGMVHLPETWIGVAVHHTIFWVFIFVITIFLVAALTAGIRYSSRCLSASPLQWAAGALTVCAAAHLLWWLLLCTVVFPRYAIMGVIYGCSALTLSMSAHLRNNNQGRNFALFIFLVMILRYDAINYVWDIITSHPDDTLKEQQLVLHKLESIKKAQPDTVFFSCGYAFEMEYLMPQVGNFVQCEQMENVAYAHKPALLISYSIDDTKKVLYSQATSFWFEERYNPEHIRSHCPTDDIYAGKYYVIASCNTP